MGPVSGDTHEPGEGDRGECTDEGCDLHPIERSVAVAEVVDECQGCAETATRSDAEQVRVGQRVTKNALVCATGGRERGPDQQAKCNPRQP